jgi:hypothetical protein
MARLDKSRGGVFFNGGAVKRQFDRGKMSELSPKEAAAEAKAAKAKAKALRPWFKKKRIIVPLALVVLIGLSTAMNGGKSGTSGSDASDSGSSSEEVETMAKIGDTVTDGDWSFVVSSLKCGINHVGSSMLGADAQGQFCVVSVSATNNGTSADYFSGSDHKIYDANGSEYEADSSNWIYLEDNMLLDKVNPGNTSKGQILFDVPKTADLDYILMSSSILSSGVKVSLK